MKNSSPNETEIKPPDHSLHPFSYYFPVEPYDIQLQISSKIYSALSQQKTRFMIVQSPTGTGKSYSLLVPALTWLSQNKYRLKPKLNLPLNPSQNKKIPSFLLKKQTHQQSSDLHQTILKKERQANLSKIIDIEQISKILKNKQKAEKQKSEVNSSQFEDLDVDEIDEQGMGENRDFKRKIDKQARFIEKQTNMEKQDVAVKIIFVSRTHSQLEQIIKAAEQINSKLQNDCKQPLLTLSLGSKNLLCCNPQIKNSSSDESQSIEEKCQFLLNKSSCPYSNNLKVRQLFGKSISQVNKITQQIKLCGYYALKSSIDCADVLFVPYSSIVNKDIRSRIGININNSIIIFDEGHNLLDFIKNSHSSEISYSEVKAFSQKVSLYSDKYGEKMKIQNKNILNHLNFLLNSILTSMDKFNSQKFGNQGQNYIKLSLLDLIIHLNLRDLKLHKIKNLLTLLDYDKKIAFFQPEPQLKTHHKPHFNPQVTVSQIHKIIDWVQKLYKLHSEEIIAIVKKQNETNEKTGYRIVFKLHCLNSNELINIINSSRLTVVAGGTMQPLHDFQNILTNNPCEIVKVGHIIKPDQCKIMCINKFQGSQIKFNHQNMISVSSLGFLKKVVSKTLNSIVSKTFSHQGIIVFIQSYKLLSIIKETLSSEDYFGSILFDSQSSQNQKVNVFETHSKRIAQKQRSILISVMGGKLSQGINFSDDLARKLVVFGLPYPNIKGAQIVEQMKYYDELKLLNFNGNSYYEGLCLKTVNQTIGRAIRHKNDWAQIYLVDKRFEGVQNKLSDWMKRSVKFVQNLQDITQSNKTKS